MKYFLLFLFIGCCFAGFSQNINLCFKSVGLKKPFYVDFSFADGMEKGAARYRGQSQSLDLRADTAFVKVDKEGHIFKTEVYKEFLNGVAVGEYWLNGQGNNYYDGHYIRYKDRKKFKLESCPMLYPIY